MILFKTSLIMFPYRILVLRIGLRARTNLFARWQRCSSGWQEERMGPSAVRKYRASIICSITTMLASLFMRSGGAPVFPPSWCEITNHSTPAPCLSYCTLAFVVKWPMFMLWNKNDCSYYSSPVLIMPLPGRYSFSWLLKMC